jgi:membrane-associated protease RseP (regulator of RpoE activity)
LNIEDVTSGDPQKNYLARYRGRLRCESTEAYDQLAADLRPRNITPLFRSEEGRHVVILMSGVVRANPSNPAVNLLMFGLTLISVFLVGAAYVYNGPPDASFSEYVLYSLAHIWDGWPFAAGLLSILLAHEFGHYLAGRFHRTHVTLPYFLPLPFPGSFGTLGAFIQLKEPPKNRRILMDIGLAGPLAGLMVAIPVLLIGLSLSQVGTINLPPGGGVQLEGNSLLYLSLKYAVFGRLLPDPATYNGLSPALYWLRYFFTGQPLPIGGLDVQLHPVAWAGWAGLLVTALNLIPAGQLDGGHLMYVLFGKRARGLLPFILTALILLGFVWPGWWLWAFLIFLLGRMHAEPLDQITPLDTKRKFMAVLGLIIFVLVFTPVPLVVAFAGI